MKNLPIQIKHLHTTIEAPFGFSEKLTGIKCDCTLLLCVFNQSTGGSPQRTPSAQQATDIRMISADVDHVIGLEQTTRGFKIPKRLIES
jgi:hypothetical protein